MVRLIERRGEWLQVEFSDGEAKTVSGYVLAKYLRPADEASPAGGAGLQ